MSDLITMQIIRNRISTLMDEMDHSIFRSGYSTIVRESHDFSVIITDHEGRLLIAPRMFLHSFTYYHFLQSLLRIYGPAGFSEGDVFISNHPYEGGVTHVPDMASLAPIFHQGRLIGFCGAMAHKADFGGTVPGSTYGKATSMFQEGTMIPPVRLYRNGVLDRDVERIIEANTRQPKLVLGDLRTQVGATQQACVRMQQMCDQFGQSVVIEAMERMLRASAIEFGDVIRALPNGTRQVEGFLDSDGVNVDEPVRLCVKVTVNDGIIEFDFDGSAPQRNGPINLRRPQIEACCFYAIIALLDPALKYGHGAHEVVRFRLPGNSVVNASPPSPTSSYMPTCQRLVDLILEALGGFKPERAIAHSGGTGGSLTIAWKGEGWENRGHQYEIFGSAYGASAKGNGASGLTVHISTTLCAPIEILEKEYPVRITRFELVKGSGGSGKFRGGDCFRRQYQLLQPATVIYRADRSKFPARGIAGGADGLPSRFVVNPGKSDEIVMPASSMVELKAGESFCIQPAAGGGYGIADQDAGSIERS
jgi:N-methylhydantoinase B